MGAMVAAEGSGPYVDVDRRTLVIGASRAVVETER